MRLVFDLETTPIPYGNGRLPDHCWMMAARDVDTGEFWWYSDEPDSCLMDEWQGPMEGALALLDRATLLIGHNIATFDLPILEELFGFELTCPLYDTLVVSQQQYFTTLAKRSYAMRRGAAKGLRGRDARTVAEEARMPGSLAFRHSLEAWGYRLQCYKGTAPKHHGVEFFEKFSREMVDYCLQDTVVNSKLFHHLTTVQAGPTHDALWPVPPVEAMLAESEYAYLLGKQARFGVGFDEAAAAALWGKLATERDELLRSLQAQVPGWWVSKGKVTVPKRDMVSKKYAPGHPKYVNRQSGCPYQNIEWTEFNPGSGQHKAHVLLKEGWVPDPDDGYTDEVGIVAGKLQSIPKTDDDTIAELPYPYIPDLRRYATLVKRCGQLAEGKKALLNFVRDGRIHGVIKPTGTRTSRCSHSNPNMNIPKVGSVYGEEFRQLFGPGAAEAAKGWVQVGADASSLEMCCLAQVLSNWDGGNFAEMLVTGVDVHESWRLACGLFYRGRQKNLNYGWLYGAGDRKLGLMVIIDWQQAFDEGLTEERPPERRYAADLGKAVRAKLLANVPGVKDMVAACKKAYQRGYVLGLDGRIIPCSSEHGVLNDKLQSFGAVVMKHAKIQFHTVVRADGHNQPQTFGYMLDVHDEWQLTTARCNADYFGAEMVEAIRFTGQKFGFVLPLGGEYKVGLNWAECH